MISVVITAFNEEKIIAETIENIDFVLRKQKTKYEIIIVNDGSTDRTEEILNNFDDTN